MGTARPQIPDLQHSTDGIFTLQSTQARGGTRPKPSLLPMQLLWNVGRNSSFTTPSTTVFPTTICFFDVKGLLPKMA